MIFLIKENDIFFRDEGKKVFIMKKKCIIVVLFSLLLVFANFCNHTTTAEVDKVSETNQDKLQQLLYQGDMMKIYPESSDVNKDKLQQLLNEGNVIEIYPESSV